PAPVATSALAAAQRMAAAQARLRAEMSRLPQQPEARLALIGALLRAQEGALEQLALIAAPRGQGQGPARAPQRLTAPGADRAATGEGGQVGGLAAEGEEGDLRRAMALARRLHADLLSDPFLPPAPEPAPQRGRAVGRRGRGRAPLRRGDVRAHGWRMRGALLVSLAKGLASRSLALIAILAAGLLLPYGNFPQARDETARGHAHPRSAPAAFLPEHGGGAVLARNEAPVLVGPGEAEAAAAPPERLLPRTDGAQDARQASATGARPTQSE